MLIRRSVGCVLGVCRQDAFTLDVLEVPQGSGSGFVWDKIGHIVTNFHVIRGASDLRFVVSLSPSCSLPTFL
jgi:S1-C subfamily serine protease